MAKLQGIQRVMPFPWQPQDELGKSAGSGSQPGRVTGVPCSGTGTMPRPATGTGEDGEENGTKMRAFHDNKPDKKKQNGK